MPSCAFWVPAIAVLISPAVAKGTSASVFWVAGFSTEWFFWCGFLLARPLIIRGICLAIYRISKVKNL